MCKNVKKSYLVQKEELIYKEKKNRLNLGDERKICLRKEP